jgi:hypothetical protein
VKGAGAVAGGAFIEGRSAAEAIGEYSHIITPAESKEPRNLRLTMRLPLTSPQGRVELWRFGLHKKIGHESSIDKATLHAFAASRRYFRAA